MKPIYLLLGVLVTICALTILGSGTVGTKKGLSSTATLDLSPAEVAITEGATPESSPTPSREPITSTDSSPGQRADGPTDTNSRSSGGAAAKSFGEETAQKAWEYHQRDREFFRQSFMGGPERLSGDKLRETFLLPEDLDADELALAIDAESAGVMERLTRLSEDYLTYLDNAIESTLVAGVPDIVPASAAVSRRYEDEFHRIIVEADGHQCVYRLRLGDHPEFSSFYSSARQLISERWRETENMVLIVTGEVRHREEAETAQTAR